jgi:hypothetical protein
MQTIHFEDHGQDFLEWDIDGDHVVDSRPLKGWLWKGAFVVNPLELVVGGKITVQQAGFEVTLKYPIVKIEENEEESCKD